jgi:hypothetical protein
MHEYDTVLKDLLKNPQSTVLERITGSKIDRWLNVEFPEVQQTRVDLLGETTSGELLGIELQSLNDLRLPLRMAEYALRTYRLYGRFPNQYALYVGEAEMSMPSELSGLNFSCRYQLFDIRSLDENDLINSPFDADNIIAILARHTNKRESIRRILARIATLEGRSRDLAITKLTILSGLRKLGDSVKKEVQQMPILDDIMDHDLLGPAIRQGIQEGELTIVRKMLNKRFGTLPDWADQRLTNLSSPEIEDLSLRLFDAKTLEELFT